MESVGGSTTSISFSTAAVEVFVLEKKDMIVLSARSFRAERTYFQTPGANFSRPNHRLLHLSCKILQFKQAQGSRNIYIAC